MNPQDIVDLYARLGHLAYEGEGITQWQHGWQCAQLARRAGAAPSLQLAAWLHDLGHLASGLEGTPTLRGLDDRHELRAAQLLRPLFGDAVAEPIALHVQAKRYLVAARPGYRDRLSADSVRSLALQGGALDEAGCAAFMHLRHADEAVRLRVWDDAGKDPDWQPSADAPSDLQRLMQQVAGTVSR